MKLVLILLLLSSSAFASARDDFEAAKAAPSANSVRRVLSAVRAKGYPTRGMRVDSNVYEVANMGGQVEGYQYSTSSANLVCEVYLGLDSKNVVSCHNRASTDSIGPQTESVTD